MKKKKASKQTSHLDNLWRQAIYNKARNRCEYCWKETHLNAHHIFSRSNYSVRWDLDNGVCLCALHHVLGTTSFHKAPAEMIEWIKKKRGVKWYNALLLRARSVMKAGEAKEKYGKILKGDSDE